ncbi:unnamed protein product [Symbiodinium natans]|uniref:Uncharacterized protein n=1 Tax=Symbiodinium natans TaxID=878477 RepID=A0A812RAH8_9DINO|nr:unnamed protein product [Symbiodinium natans]
MRLQQLEEVAQCELDRFRGFAAKSQPCVLRGVAGDWPMVARGRFKDNTQLLRERLGDRRCLVSFDPTASFFNYEIPKSFQTMSRQNRKPPGADAPRLVNPGRLEMQFADFLTAASLKQGAPFTDVVAPAVNMPYDADDVGQGSEFETMLHVPLSEIQQLSLYCVDDAADWPEDLLQEFVPGDLAAKLLPEWQPLLQVLPCAEWQDRCSSSPLSKHQLCVSDDSCHEHCRRYLLPPSNCFLPVGQVWNAILQTSSMADVHLNRWKDPGI